MTDSIFIFGAGYSAQAFARMNTTDTRIAGTTRLREKFDALRQAGIVPLLFESKANAELLAELAQATQLVVSIAPDETGDAALDAFRAAGALPKLRWIGYLSTVGVYGDHGGDWVDERAECRPVSNRSRLRVEAERRWMEAGEAAGIPVVVLRLSGIYGPGRNAFVNLENGTAKRLVKPGQVFNRIHVADIAGALWHLAQARTGGIFNVTDDEPAPPQDVVTYAASLMGVEPPPEMAFETATLSPMARSFYGENKRVSNSALKAAGYPLRFADYRAALDHMWTTGDWRNGAPRSAMKRP